MTNRKISLKTKKKVAEALMDRFLDGDGMAFKKILRTHVEGLSLDEVVKTTGLPRATLFRMLKPKANPTMSNLLKLLRVLKTT